VSAEKRWIRQILRIMLSFEKITVQKELRRRLKYTWYNVRWFVKRLVIVYLGLIFDFISLHVLVKIMPYQFSRSFAIQDSVIFAKKSLYSENEIKMGDILLTLTKS
jgi:hypothetical protein